MKRKYLQPDTQLVPFAAGELMIPTVGVGSGGQQTGIPLNPTTGAPRRLSTMYI